MMSGVTKLGGSIIILLIIVSCGTRKVETTKLDLNNKSLLIESNKERIDSVITNIFRRFEFESRKTADSVVVSDNKTTYYNVIHEDKITDSTSVDNLQTTRYEEDATKKVESVILKTKEKQTERVVHWWFFIFFIIICFYFLIKRLRK